MKASALHIVQKMDIPDYALGTQALWTVKLVREALVDAFRLLNRVGGRVGPVGLKAYWPEYAEAGDCPSAMTKVSPHRTRISVTRMEMIMTGWKDDNGEHQPGWLMGPLDAVPDLREVLLAWIQAELRGESDKDLCQRKRWALATFKRHRDTAAGLIAQRLNRVGVEVW